MAGEVGGVEVKEIVWLSFGTTTICCTWGAAAKVEFPAWLASSVHVPAWARVTTPLKEIEHTEDEVVSTVMATVRPDVDVAVGV